MLRVFAASWFHRSLILCIFLLLSSSGGGLVGHLALLMLPSFADGWLRVCWTTQQRGQWAIDAYKETIQGME